MKQRQQFVATHGNADGHRRHHCSDVGLVNVSAQAGNVAYIVADVVGDHAWIPWIVLRYTRLDLTDQIGADVGRLGEDAAADAREQRDRRGTHGKAPDDVNVSGGSEEVEEHSEA